MYLPNGIDHLPYSRGMMIVVFGDKMQMLKVTRPEARLDPALIFPVEDQKKLSDQINGYLSKGATSPF